MKLPFEVDCTGILQNSLQPSLAELALAIAGKDITMRILTFVDVAHSTAYAEGVAICCGLLIDA